MLFQVLRSEVVPMGLQLGCPAVWFVHTELAGIISSRIYVLQSMYVSYRAYM